MEREISKTVRRSLVVFNYLSLAVIVILVHLGSAYGWDLRLILAGVLAGLAVLLATFLGVFWRTGLWHLAHATFENLDERQAHVMYESLRRSYSVFAVLCLIVLVVNSVAEMGNVPILVAVGLLYLAHTLPAAAVAWTEKEVLIDH